MDIRDRGSYHATDDYRDQVLAEMRTSVSSMMDVGAQYQDVTCQSHGDSEDPENFEWVVDEGQVLVVRTVM